MAAQLIDDVALWLHDFACRRCGDRPCEGRNRIEHSRAHDDLTRSVIAAGSRDALADLLHASFCPAWGRRPHGDPFIQRADESCGANGREHAERIARTRPFNELAAMLGFI